MKKIRSNKKGSPAIWIIFSVVLVILIFIPIVNLYGNVISGANDAIISNCKHISGKWNGVCRLKSVDCDALYGEDDYSKFIGYEKACYIKGDKDSQDLKCCVPKNNPVEDILIMSVIDGVQKPLMASKDAATIYIEGEENVEIAFKISNIPSEYFFYDKISFELSPFGAGTSCINEIYTEDCLNSKECVFPAPIVSGESVVFKYKTLGLGGCKIRIIGYNQTDVSFVKEGTIHITDRSKS